MNECTGQASRAYSADLRDCLNVEIGREVELDDIKDQRCDDREYLYDPNLPASAFF
jgi:hypothetical protein